MQESFFDFLMRKCMEDTHALDDDLPEVYSDWIVDQPIDYLIAWAEEWHESNSLKGE